MPEHGGSRQTERKRDRRGTRKALTRKDGEGRNSVTGEQDKPVDHYLAMDIEYQMEDRRRLHIRLLLLKMTNIFWREKPREWKKEMDEIWNPMETDTQSFWIAIQ